MPTYDFLCENCGYVELHHSIHDDHPEICPQCKKGKIKIAILTAPPVRYIGRGNADGWRQQRVELQQPTSEEYDVPYE